MGSAEIEKTKLQITERLRHPSELRRGVLSSNGPRNFSVNGGPPRHRAILRPADRTDSQHQPPPKRRLSSAAVVKVDDGEIIDDVEAVTDVINRKDLPREDNDGACTEDQSERKPSNLQKSGWSRRDGNQRAVKMISEMPLARSPRRDMQEGELFALDVGDHPTSSYEEVVGSTSQGLSDIPPMVEPTTSSAVLAASTRTYGVSCGLQLGPGDADRPQFSIPDEWHAPVAPYVTNFACEAGCRVRQDMANLHYDQLSRISAPERVSIVESMKVVDGVINTKLATRAKDHKYKLYQAWKKLVHEAGEEYACSNPPGFCAQVTWVNLIDHTWTNDKFKIQKNEGWQALQSNAAPLTSEQISSMFVRSRSGVVKDIGMRSFSSLRTTANSFKRPNEEVARLMREMEQQRQQIEEQRQQMEEHRKVLEAQRLQLDTAMEFLRRMGYQGPPPPPR